MYGQCATRVVCGASKCQMVVIEYNNNSAWRSVLAVLSCQRFDCIHGMDISCRQADRVDWSWWQTGATVYTCIVAIQVSVKTASLDAQASAAVYEMNCSGRPRSGLGGVMAVSAAWRMSVRTFNVSVCVCVCRRLFRCSYLTARVVTWWLMSRWPVVSCVDWWWRDEMFLSWQAGQSLNTFPTCSSVSHIMHSLTLL